MKEGRLGIALGAIAMTSTLLAQQTASDSWQWVGPDQGWPGGRSARPIHLVHVPPTSPAMETAGKSFSGERAMEAR